MSKTQDGKGDSKIVTPEENAAARKAAQLRKKSRAGHGHQDPAHQRQVGQVQKARQAMYRKLQTRKFDVSRTDAADARKGIAQVAKSHPQVTGLYGLPKKVAELALEAYGNLLPGQTGWEFVRLSVHDKLSTEELKQEPKLTLGLRRARKAKEDAFDAFCQTFWEEETTAEVEPVSEEAEETAAAQATD